MPKLVRDMEHGTVHRGSHGYIVKISAHNGGEFEAEPGFTGADFDVIVPFQVGNGMTYAQLIAEAWRRFDQIKHLL